MDSHHAGNHRGTVKKSDIVWLWRSLRQVAQQHPRTPYNPYPILSTAEVDERKINGGQWGKGPFSPLRLLIRTDLDIHGILWIPWSVLEPILFHPWRLEIWIRKQNGRKPEAALISTVYAICQDYVAMHFLPQRSHRQQSTSHSSN